MSFQTLLPDGGLQESTGWNKRWWKHSQNEITVEPHYRHNHL